VRQLVLGMDRTIITTSFDPSAFSAELYFHFRVKDPRNATEAEIPAGKRSSRSVQLG